MTDGATVIAAEELSYSIVRFVVHRGHATVGRVSLLFRNSRFMG